MNENTSKNLNERQPFEQRKFLTYLSVVGSLTIYAMVAAFLIGHPHTISSEPSLYLACAKGLLLGQSPYVDFLVGDWPTTIFTGILPAMAAQVAHVPESLLFNLCALAIGLVSTVLCGFMLLPLRHHQQWHCFPFLVIALATLNAILIYQIGQPQYLAFFAIVPYIVFQWLRQEQEKRSPILAVLTGLFAAFALTLDPLTIIVPVALELYWLFAKPGKKLRDIFNAESVSCLCGFILIFIAMAFLSNPVQVQNFCNIEQPTMAWNTQHIDVTTAERTAAPDRRDVVLWGSMLSFAALMLFQRCTMLSPFAIVFFCGLLIAAIEQQGLSRQYLLMLGSSTTMSALILGVTSSWLATQKKFAKLFLLLKHKAFMTLLFVIIPAVGCWFTIDRLERRPQLESWQTVDQLDARIGTVNGVRELVEKYSRSGEPVLFLQKRTFPAFPLTTQLGRVPCNRFFDPGCIASLADAPEEPQRNESTKLCLLLKEDISQRKPALIFIEDGTMREKLKNSGVIDSIEQEYSHVGSWRVKSENREPIEYFGTRLPLHAYIRNDRLQQESEVSEP